MSTTDIKFNERILTESPKHAPYLNAIWSYISASLIPFDNDGGITSTGNIGGQSNQWRNIITDNFRLKNDIGIANIIPSTDSATGVVSYTPYLPTTISFK